MSSHESLFSANVCYENGDLLLYLTGELDIATAPLLRQAVTDLVRPGLRGLTLDLEALTFIDVVGMRAFCQAREMAAAVGAAFFLCSVRDLTRRVIRLAQFDDLEDTIIERASDASAA